jgi:glutamyl-tRNA reductase
MPEADERMDYIGIVGTSYRTTSVETLAEAALPIDFRDENLVELARLSGFSELVYLGTCNRVEFYFRGETRIHTNQLMFHLRRSLDDLTDGQCQLPDEERLYVHFGRSAVRHLFRVTAGLDSMMVGEAQILGQTKEAHQIAHDLGLLSGILDQTFHEAFHLAKRIRNETELARRPVSLVTLVERTLHDHLADSAEPVLILGAGEMAGQTLKLIRSGDPDRQVIVANRHPERASAMVAGDASAEARPLTEVQADPPRTSLVAAVTSSEEPILDADQVAAIRSQLPEDEHLLLVDLAMPPNVHPSARELDGVEVHGIEEMRDEAERNRQLRLAEMNRCEGLVEHQLETLRRHLLDRELSPVARGLHQSFGEVADRSLKHALGKDLAHLDESDRLALEKLVRDMTKRMVQAPLRGLKTAARNHSSAVIGNFLRGLEGDNGNGTGDSK